MNRVIVDPKYRGLNSLLVAAYVLVSIAQIVQAVIGPAIVLHSLVALLFGFLAFCVYRVTPWAYIAIALMNFIGMVGMLKNLASLGIYGFVALFIAGLTAWVAIFLRSHLLFVTEPNGA